jgi:hypothetical protein
MKLHGWTLSLFHHEPDNAAPIIHDLQTQLAAARDEAESLAYYRKLWEAAAHELVAIKEAQRKAEKRNK